MFLVKASRWELNNSQNTPIINFLCDRRGLNISTSLQQPAKMPLGMMVLACLTSHWQNGNSFLLLYMHRRESIEDVSLIFWLVNRRWIEHVFSMATVAFTLPNICWYLFLAGSTWELKKLFSWTRVSTHDQMVGWQACQALLYPGSQPSVNKITMYFSSQNRS